MSFNLREANWGKKILGVGVLTLLMSSCSSSYDGWFANPCPTSFVVRTFYVARGNGTPRPGSMIAEATLAPEAVTKVKKAFQDANGFTWFVTIGDSEPIQLTKADMPHWVVGLPASMCTAT